MVHDKVYWSPMEATYMVSSNLRWGRCCSSLGSCCTWRAGCWPSASAWEPALAGKEWKEDPIRHSVSVNHSARVGTPCRWPCSGTAATSPTSARSTGAASPRSLGPISMTRSPCNAPSCNPGKGPASLSGPHGIAHNHPGLEHRCIEQRHCLLPGSEKGEQGGRRRSSWCWLLVFDMDGKNSPAIYRCGDVTLVC